MVPTTDEAFGQEEALLIEEAQNRTVSPARGCNQRRFLLSGLAIAAVCTMAVFLPTTSRQGGVVVQQQHHSFTSFAKAFAVERRGRTMTDADARAVLEFAQSRGPRTARLARKLQDGDENELGKRCSKALTQFGVVFSEELWNWFIDVFVNCLGDDGDWDEEVCSDEKMEAKHDKFFADQGKKCAAEGDACTIAFTEEEATEEEEVCIPKECHDSASKPSVQMKKMLGVFLKADAEGFDADEANHGAKVEDEMSYDIKCKN